MSPGIKPRASPSRTTIQPYFSFRQVITFIQVFELTRHNNEKQINNIVTAKLHKQKQILQTLGVPLPTHVTIQVVH